jgi:hypothetical protein
MRRYSLIIFPALLMLLLPCIAQSTPPDSVAAGSTHTVPWDFSLAASYYSFPFDEDIAMVVGRAQRGSLHLEGRYGYEDRRTASLFAGWTFSKGEDFTIEVTPMGGVAFGNTRGIIPALEMSLGYRAFDFYAETEYLFDLNDKSGNFAYTWLELAVSPTELLRTGLVAQRTRVFQTPLDLDRGVFAQLKPGPAILSLYAFNPFTDSWFLTLGLEIDW